MGRPARPARSTAGIATRWPEAQVVALEPSSESFALLTRNVEGYANIRAVHAAISDRRAYLRVADEGRQPRGVRTQELEVGEAEDGEPSGPAPEGMACSVTVPDLVAACPEAELFIVKIDIEGFERELFRSNHDWADAAPLVVFEPHDWLIPFGGTGHTVFSALAGAPRDYLMRGENVFAFSVPLLKPFAEG
ncbi:FkbM family methyltransferase [Albimonas sp. CAU 1670]|uniref:FkbM family methyltransferase n=1 Tax=Albimonas sp. CAU 1670 TaxID=3032599 RepID=UPI0023D985BF|nr:FkbM family methyltransferase [Albimonas sp. CAU 1670]MDF2234199.1 FkbM family methyltransferase [Albimonas sp. CAU 1670]